jgi:hypothetical protein
MMVLWLLFVLLLQLVATAGLVARPSSRRSQGLQELKASPRELEQFELVRKTMLGVWKGVQTGYDPAEPMVEDHMYTEVSCSEEGGELVHVNGVVAGEIRADCEVCYDSERLKSKEVGRYSPGKLPGMRACYNCVLRGPGPTRRGMSMEILLHCPDGSPLGENDMRVRVLLAYAPIDFQEIEGVGPVPCALGLTDVILVRERKGARRPLKLDEGPDVMWKPPVEGFALGLGPGAGSGPELTQRDSFMPDGLVVRESNLRLSYSPLQLPAPTEASPAAHARADLYERSFAGGLRIEAGAVVYAGLESRLRVQWAVPEEEDGHRPSRCFRAEVAFKALETVTVEAQGVRVSPPEVLGFSVEHD